MEAFRRVSIIKQAGQSSEGEYVELEVQKKNISNIKEKEDMINLLSPYHFGNRCSYKIDKEEEFRLEQLISKSAYASLNHSP
jgi:hypothetical protein